ncbi:MAG TPA: YceI family protein [Bacteroidales bacterium]|nr:YceI family protein [Bacteroidales bacterium]
MKKNRFSFKTGFIALSLVLSSCFALNAQVLKINPKTFNMTILGTTNVHDFKSKVTSAKGEAVVNNKELQSLTVEIPVRSIKSGEKLMDTKTYETFDVDKYPNITFKLTEVNSLNVVGNQVNVLLTGNLTMAGVTRKISVKSTGSADKPGVYEFKGSVALKMTDFKMRPPTAMLGVMKVGDAITLKFDVSFENPQLAQVQ